MKNHLIAIRWGRDLLLLGSLACWAVACSTPRELAPVRPKPAADAGGAGPSGRLRVYTAEERHTDGDGLCYYPHTAYFVFDAKGHEVLHVPNHVGTMDEVPSTVVLPAGTYTVLAQDAGWGRVKVPVAVEPGRCTVVHLDSGSAH